MWWAPRQSGSYSMGFGTFFSFWRNQAKTFRAYWAIYGGFLDFFKSPYLHVSAILAGVCIYYVDLSKVQFSSIAINVIPNILGFTLGAMAIALAFSSAELFKQIAEEGRPDSFFMKLMANLVHFTIAQVSALVVAIVAQAVQSPLLEYLTIALLLYAVLVTLATGMQLFHAAVVYNAAASLPGEEDSKRSPDSSGN